MRELFEYTGECERCHELLAPCESAHCGWQRVDLLVELKEQNARREVPAFKLKIPMSVMDCSHPKVEPQRNAGLRQTELVCCNCEATLRIVTDLQESESWLSPALTHAAEILASEEAEVG